MTTTTTWCPLSPSPPAAPPPRAPIPGSRSRRRRSSAAAFPRTTTRTRRMRRTWSSRRRRTTRRPWRRCSGPRRRSSVSRRRRRRPAAAVDGPSDVASRRARTRSPRRKSRRMRSPARRRTWTRCPSGTRLGSPARGRSRRSTTTPSSTKATPTSWRTPCCSRLRTALRSPMSPSSRFYRPEEADKKGGGSWVARDTRELFYSFHIDDVPAESVMHKCVVHFIPQHKHIPSRKQHPGFIVQKVYDAVEKKLWNLTDKDYEDNKQQEIDLLVKKTIDRIGQLPDLEPEEIPIDNSGHLSNKRGLRKRPVNPIDVTREPPIGKSEHFAKAETPGSDKLKNYDILVRYKALSGEENRDKGIDKLVDCIPLASKESARASHADPDAAAKSSTNGSSAKDVGSADNEKSYTYDVIVPIMVALERSAFEALGNDFSKYNQKLRQLIFNIKVTCKHNSLMAFGIIAALPFDKGRIRCMALEKTCLSSKLRSRLMDKELDPPALLTMSPDELKAGLTSAEKTSEPEESRQLQMTDTRCERCNEKKVGIFNIIHAGHGDRYQLECTSCGHTWFSSRDAITTLTEDAPSTAGNVGTAPWATAKFDVLEKLASPRGQPDKPPAAGALQKSTAAYMPTLEKQKLAKPKTEEPSPVPPPNQE